MNVTELNQTLVDQIVKLESGETTPARANAIVHAVATYFSGIRLVLSYHHQRGTLPEIMALEPGKRGNHSRGKVPIAERPKVPLDKRAKKA